MSAATLSVAGAAVLPPAKGLSRCSSRPMTAPARLGASGRAVVFLGRAKVSPHCSLASARHRFDRCRGPAVLLLNGSLRRSIPSRSHPEMPLFVPAPLSSVARQRLRCQPGASAVPPGARTIRPLVPCLRDRCQSATRGCRPATTRGSRVGASIQAGHMRSVVAEPSRASRNMLGNGVACRETHIATVPLQPS